MHVRVTLGPSSHDDRDVDPPRPLSQWELALVHWLLDGSSESRVAERQISSAVVDAECASHCPTVWVRVDDTVPPLEDLRWGPTSGALPVMGVSEDADGAAINAILQIANGYVRELDIHRVDGQTFRSRPAVTTFRRAPL